MYIIKKYRLLYFIAVVLLSVVFTIYYFGIQVGVIPSYEELFGLVNGYLSLHKGLNWPGLSEGLRGRLCVLAAYFFGVRYGGMRVVWAVFYFLISLFALDLSIRDNDWNCRIYAVPAYILLMVLMHLSGEYLSYYYGKFFYVKDQYPFNIHMGTTLAVLIFLWVCYRMERWKFCSKVGEKFVVYLITGVVCFLISGSADIVLLLSGLIMPLILFLLRPYLLNDHKRYRILVCTLIVAVVLNFIIGHKFDEVMLFLQRYHIQNFVDIQNLCNWLLAYIADISGTFNFDIWGREFELGVIVSIARVIMVVYIYLLVYKNIKLYFKKTNSVDVMEQIISWTFLIISVGFIFTTLGFWDKARYFNIFLPYGTILLCKNIDRFIQFVRIPSRKDFIVVGVLLILLSYNHVWGQYRENNVLDDDWREINILVDEKGLHEGLGTAKSFPSVIAQGKGAHWVYPARYNEEMSTFYLEHDIDYADCFFDYFVVDREDETTLVNDSGSFMSEDVINTYGNPDERIIFNCYEVWIYRTGIECSYSDL